MSNETDTHTYDQNFYGRQAADSLESARQVAPFVVDLLDPKSVVDIGCGVGTWLAAFQACGIQDILGLDGSYVLESPLLIPGQSFLPADLEQAIELDRRFDLAISLEVAEHLTKSEQLVDELSRLSDVILFSAAVPLQGGRHHINEQPASYWAGLFQAAGFTTVDILRPTFWNNSQVKWWYRQNMLLFVRDEKLQSLPSLLPYVHKPGEQILDIIHPEGFQEKITSSKERLAEIHLTYKRRMSDLKKEIWEKAKRSLGKQ